MTAKKAEGLYKQILDRLSELKGDAFWLFRDELIRILVTPDSQFTYRARIISPAAASHPLTQTKITCDTVQ